MLLKKEQRSKTGLDLFIERFRDHWLSNFPRRFSSTSVEEIEDLASAAVRETEARGIENEDVTVAYADLCLVAGTGFAAQLTPSPKPLATPAAKTAVSEWSESDIGFAVLDVAGVVPVYEEDADVTDALEAAADGRYLDAGLLLVSVIPVVGYVVGKETGITREWDPVAANRILEAVRDIPVYRFLRRFKSHSELGKYSKEIGTKLETWQRLIK